MSDIRARSLHRQGKCGVVLIDYLQLCRAEYITKNETRDQLIGEQTRQAKEIAKELGIPVILLAQLNRDLEKRGNRIPQLSDLRDSGNIEQDADVVMFLYRPDYYGQTITDAQGRVIENGGELIIAKNRNGRTGRVRFIHGQGLCKIYDYSPQTPPMDTTSKYSTCVYSPPPVEMESGYKNYYEPNRDSADALPF